MPNFAAMLRRLSITNYLLIEQLELDLEKGFTAITGETGSGKSILIGALGLVMGERVEGAVARDPAKRCIIELEVRAGKDRALLAEWCAANEVPSEEPMLLRRQLDPGGRSRAFVNDTPVRLEQLRELAAQLIHIHSQHHTLLLNDTGFQLGLVDHAAGTQADAHTYAEQFQRWKAVRAQLDALREEEAKAQGELDYVRFQLEELEAARPVAGEQAGLEEALARAEHAHEILAALEATEQGVRGDGGMLSPWSRLKALLTRTGRLDPGLQALQDRLQSVSIELNDIADEAERLATGTNIDPEQAARLRERLDLLHRLQQKHRVPDVEGLIALRDGLRVRSGDIGSMGERITALEGEEKQVWQQLSVQADALSAARVTTMPRLAEQVSALLHDLGMPHAVFTFEHARTAPGPTGVDRVKALFSANKDRAPAPLDKVASGGELSRVMLALIGLAAESKGLSTVLFDEIDTGVSGETAHRVGALMARMAKDRQVIAITHLPQIASKAHTHLLVSKDHEAEHVQSDIRPLNVDERVQALARMLSGSKPGKAALENARELLKAK